MDEDVENISRTSLFFKWNAIFFILLSDSSF